MQSKKNANESQEKNPIKKFQNRQQNTIPSVISKLFPHRPRKTLESIPLYRMEAKPAVKTPTTAQSP
jgi:hypothetical protein